MVKKRTFDKLAITDLDDFVYGSCPNPVKTKSGMEFGGGTVYPELNFTLPTMDVDEDSIDKAYGIYRKIAQDGLKRAAELEVPGILLEYESTVEFTMNPDWGIKVANILLEEIDEAQDKYGLKSGLRMTVNDNREFDRPPIMRSGENWEKMKYFFTETAKAGADFLSIESTGGKELSDEALVRVDLETLVFAVGVLGARDMEFLWGEIAKIADENGSVPAGDTACGFANTAMVLAEKGFVPRIFGAVVRAALAPRSLVAFEQGAIGPSKDCAYEGPYLKAITGMPISMEGRMACGAHLSRVGNIASAVCDLWSNESIQYIRLLSDMAPTVAAEQLAYDCRLMNGAESIEEKRFIRDLNVKSDAYLDPHGWILRPDVVLRISQKIVEQDTALKRTKAACAAAIDELKTAINDGNLRADKRDKKWFKRMEKALDNIPDDELEFYEKIKPKLDMSLFNPEEYGL